VNTGSVKGSPVTTAEEQARIVRQVAAHLDAREARIMAERASERLLRIARVVRGNKS
jgi:hypothetical protein